MSGRDRRLSAAEQRVGRLRVPKRLEDTFGPYRDTPVEFCTAVLGVTSATRRSTGAPYQLDVLADIPTQPRVAVRSGHGVGKSAIDAWAAIWWLTTRPLSRVLVLAPEFSRQVRAVLFSEIRKWVRRSHVKLPLEVLANRVLVEGFGEEWSATGMSTAGDPDRIEGFHAEGGVLLIVDETKGVPQESFDAVQGALSGLEDSRLLVTSVPGGAGAGPFWKACQDPGRWRIHHVPASDSALVSLAWVEDRRRDWGDGSPLYACRVLGEFADAGEGVLFPLPLLEAAIGRVLEASDRLVLGVDVARSIAGDKNCVAVARGGRLERLSLWHSADLMQTTQRVLEHVATTGAQMLAIDVGGPGGGVVDRLRQLGHAVEAVAFGGAASDPTRFANRRAELYWTLRHGLERGAVALPEDDDLIADLSAIRYAFDQRGRIVLESKDEVRARLGRSPDRADAVALACWAASGGGMPGRGVFEFARVEAERVAAARAAGPLAGAAEREQELERVRRALPRFGFSVAPASCASCGSIHVAVTTPGHTQCKQCGATDVVPT